MSELTPRQEKIYQLIKSRKNASNRELLEQFPEISRVTLYRDLDRLCDLKFIVREGKGRNVRYAEHPAILLFRPIDPIVYFSVSPDKREDVKTSFNADAISQLPSIFTDEERGELDALTVEYQARVKSLSPGILKKEYERLTIELAWKSSQIEGNTYSLIDTETLLKDRKEAKGHTQKEAVMLLNHKAALDWIREAKDDFKTMSLARIRSVHALLVKDLEIETGFRSRGVGITGTTYKPLDNVHQIQEAMEALTKEINAAASVFDKAVMAMLVIAYIQPFEDGNKRTSRLVGDAILLAFDACPLSFRSIEESEYKQAVLLFYEQNNVRMFKRLFMEQYRFAVDTYFR